MTDHGGDELFGTK